MVQWTLPAVICPEAPPRAPKCTAGPPGTCLNLHLDGLCGAMVSTDAHATHLLHCWCASEQQVSGLPTPPQPQRLGGWPLAAGNQPSTTRVDDSKRPREDPARRREQVRPDRWFTAKMHAHEEPLFREPVSVPMVLRNAADLTEAPPGRMDAEKGKQRA